MNFVWAERSTVYHEFPWAGENCNTDDLRHRVTGETPPPKRRLCYYCRRAKQLAQGVRS